MTNMIDELPRLEALPQVISAMGEPRAAAILALDIGTSGVRAALFDGKGREVSGVTVRLPSKACNLIETGAVDADLLVEEVSAAIDVLLLRTNDVDWPTGGIELIASSCFWHSLVGVDRRGRPTTPVFGWNDTRSAAAASVLRTRHDEAKLQARTGCRFHPSYWPAKLLRLKTEQPQVFKATEHWLSFSDYLTSRFSGETVTSVSMASGTGLLNQHSCEWDAELLTALDISVDSLPDIAAEYYQPGKLTGAYVDRWPPLANVGVLPAIGDGAANNFGVGCLTREKIALMVGTSGAMRVIYRGEPPAKVPPELWSYRLDRSRVVVGGALSDGGGLFSWWKGLLFPNDTDEFIESELATLEPDAHGLTVLPFWMGERSTGWKQDATGAIVGLTTQTRPIEIVRAAMEAVAYRFALIAKALEPLAPGAEIIASGHALRSSPTWVQIMADVLGRRVTVSELSEASTRGAALLALEAVGKIPAIESFSVADQNQLATFVEPDMSHHSRYQAGLERQERLYEKVTSEI